jgi:hypothetical protein
MIHSERYHSVPEKNNFCTFDQKASDSIKVKKKRLKSSGFTTR